MEQWLAKIKKSSVDFIGYPCCFGQEKKGVETGPSVMRKNGIIKQLEDMNVPTRDLGDVEVLDFKETDKVLNLKRPKGVGNANKNLSKAVKKIVEENHMAVVLGGDHCLGIGAVHGHSLASPGLKLIWVDAHADINPPELSSTSNIHGMPVCFLAKELTAYIKNGIPGFEWFNPCLSLKDIVYIGLRDVDQAERKILKKYNVKAFSACDVSRLGISEVLKRTFEYLKPSKDHPIHLNIDIDGLDPIHTASTGTPVEGGLTLREGMNIVETIAASGFLEVLAIAEVNPSIGTEAQKISTLEAANELVASAFAKRTIIPYNED